MRALTAAGVDLAAAALVAILLWPFPLFRLTLGLPWAVHGVLIFVWVFVVYTAYLTLSVLAWTRTPVMYLLDLGLRDGSPRFGFGRSLRWALGWALAVLPGLVGARSLTAPETGLPARLSGLVTVTAEPSAE